MKCFLGLIVGTLICLLGITHTAYREPRRPIITCSDLNRISYCSSCFNVTACEPGFDGNTTGCDVETQACFQDEVGSYCTSKQNVPECQCPTPIGTGKEDYYDPSKFYFCLESGIVLGECGPGEYFNDTTRMCENIFMSTPFAPQTPSECADDEISYNAIDCTRYQECVLGISEIYECENGDTFNSFTNLCELYIPFSCTEKENGQYPDSVDCQSYHVCEAGLEIENLNCEIGMVYDPEFENCTFNHEACKLTGCFVPIPDYVQCLFGNETYQINHDSYYECVTSPSGTFEVIPRECPQNNYFDAEDAVCRPYGDLRKKRYENLIPQIENSVDYDDHSEPKKSRITCVDITRSSYCSSCFNITYCQNGYETYTEGCDVETEVCVQDNYGSYCGDKDFVPECRCPLEVGMGKTDFYDPQKYFFCLREGIVLGECESSQYFNETTRVCENVFLSTPFAPQTTSECDDTGLSIVILDCTRYQECISGISEIYECEVGDVVSSETNACELYIPFTCTGKADGQYRDSVRCDISRICEGQILVSTVPCSNGTVFDPITQTCTQDSSACTLNGCFYPTPDYVTCSFGNETYQINHDSYYQCNLTVTGDYEALPKECPDGSYFDADEGQCQLYSYF